MPCCYFSASKPVGPLKEQAEFDRRVAVYAWIGCPAVHVFPYEWRYYLLAELVAYIGNVVRNAQLPCQLRGILCGTQSTVAGYQRESFYPVTLLKQHAAHGCAVNAAAHSHKYALLFKHITVIG